MFPTVFYPLCFDRLLVKMVSLGVVLLLVLCNCLPLTLQETVKVSLYYEVLCPYSKEFIADQLYPGYEALGNTLNLELIPFGKAKQRKVHGKWQTSCPHGPKECYANKLQACVLNQNYTQEESMNFIGCLMNSDDPHDNGIARKCADKIKLSWKTIKACAKGDEGNELFAHFGDVTANLTPKLQYVPHIRFNNENNDTVETAARNDFLETVCSIFVEKPSGCV